MMANRYSFKESQQQANTIQSNVPGFSGRNVWPQQQLQLQTEEQKQREYLKQQQKLRLMSAGLRKQPVSADKLIENLLEKEDTFRPKVSAQITPSVPIAGHQAHGRPGGSSMVAFPQASSNYIPIPAAPASLTSIDVKQGTLQKSQQILCENAVGEEFSDLQSSPSQALHKTQAQMPSWISSSPTIPAMYRQVWTFAGNDKGFVDTSKILPILLTSGLTTDVLGYIWGLANQKVAGHLTEEELYIVLALVALAQSGCTFNSVSILSVLPQPPIPNLNLGAMRLEVTQGRETSGFQPIKNQQEQVNLHVEPDNTVDTDDFTDFQSAVFETTSVATVTTTVATTTFTTDSTAITSKENVSPVDSSLLAAESRSLPDVSINQKFPSVVVKSNSGRGIGSRLANHSLGTPRQAKARHHKHQHHHHHHHHHRSHQLPLHTVSAPVDDEFSDFQQAKDVDSEVSCDTSEIFAKCVTKAVPSKTFVLKESAIRSEKRFDEDQQLSSTEIVTNTSGEVNVDIPQAEKPNSGVNLVTASKELMSVEEDKYSALRALSFPSVEPSGEEGDHNSSDDFGDFLSAEIPPAVAPYSGVIAKEQSISGNPVPAVQESMWPSANTNSLQSVDFNGDDWGSFESAPTSVGILSVPVDSCASNTKVDNISSEPVITLPSSKGGLDFTSDSFTWDFNLAVTQTTKDIESWKISEPNVSETAGEFESWNLEPGEKAAEKDSGLNFLGKIYDRPIGVGDGKVDFLASESESSVTNNTLTVEGKDDEFGEFIGSEMWSTDGKYTKDNLFDIQSGLSVKESTFDNQSVSSLELPPVALSRHGSLPSLELKIFPPSGEKTNGHQSWDSPSQGAEHQIHEWCRCVQGCMELLQAAHTIFSSISSDEVLLEVLNAQKGRDYLINLLEVYGIFRRVRSSANHTMADTKQLETLFASMDNLWSNLEHFFVKANITVDQESVSNTAVENQQSSSNSYERYVCGICLNSIGNDLMDQDSNTCHLEYGGQVYHAACANLWVNCVDCSLPSLTLL